MFYLLLLFCIGLLFQFCTLVERFVFPVHDEYPWETSIDETFFFFVNYAT